ncbi:MAG: hypothetical protein QM691_08165 [Opitutaceae bacterium]
MIPFLAFSAAAAANWFGPTQASFPAELHGNPYDFRMNDVRVVFTAADGRREERLAFYDAGHWRAWLTTGAPGEFHATLVRNRTEIGVPAQEVRVRESARLRGGYVRTEGERFRLDSGEAFLPLGYNLAWHAEGQRPLPKQLARMGAAGLNWTRIWACAWDGKNPFVGYGRPNPPLGGMVPEVMARWDGIVAAAEAAGVRLQFVLFHHGLVSTRNDSNWAGHPWNRANGGFLDRPQQFFTDATAKEYQKRWLRYAVARWGHSPAIMAWELFNEVEWVDAAQVDGDWPTVVGWHAEMAAFLRALDPYGHLVTTSAAREHPELYGAMDYFQPHTYPRDVFNGIAGVPRPSGKPWFFGEFGRGTWEQNADEHCVVRDGIWAGVLSGHAGAAQYWFWDRVQEQKLEPEFARAARALAWSQLAGRTGLKPVAVRIAGAPVAPLCLAPGRGWGATERYRYALPDDATPEKLAQWSSYLNPRSEENAGLAREPLEFAFTLAEAGEFEVAFTSLAGRGSGLRISIDGREAKQVSWPAAEKVVLSPTGGRAHQPAPAPVRLTLGAGAHVVGLECTGPDWVQIDRVAIPGLGQAIRAHALAGADFALVRLQAEKNGIGTTVDLRIEGMADGAFRLRILDLESGVEAEQLAEVRGGVLRGFGVERADAILILSR